MFIDNNSWHLIMVMSFTTTDKMTNNIEDRNK